MEGQPAQGVKGKYYTLPKSYFDLRPVQQPHPPIYFAAFSPAAMKRLAPVLGDGWLPMMIPPAGMKQMWDGIIQMARQAGRDTSKMEFVVRANIVVTDARLGDSRRIFGRWAEDCADIAACRDIGAAEVAFDPAFKNVDEFPGLIEMLGSWPVSRSAAQSERPDTSPPPPQNPPPAPYG